MDKLFTVEEANRSLTLLRPIVQDIMSKMQHAQAIQEQVKRTKNQLLSEKKETEVLSALRDAEQLLNEIEYHMKELESIGVMLRDFTYGLVDFPAMINGTQAYLCWKFDEASVAYWHEANVGFEGRQPLSTLQKAAL